MSKRKIDYSPKNSKAFWRELFSRFLEIFPYIYRNTKGVGGWGFETEMVVRVFYGLRDFPPHTAKNTALLGFMSEKKVLNILRKAQRICKAKMTKFDVTKRILDELRKKYPVGSLGQ